MIKPHRWSFQPKSAADDPIGGVLCDLCLTAAFLALVILCRFISQYFNFINGYSLQIQYVPLIMGLICIQRARYRFLLYLIAPIVELALGFSGNPIFDYLFTSWSLWIFLTIKKRFKPHSSCSNYFWMLIGISISFLQMYWWNTLSGVLFYQVDWTYSLVFNGVFNLINYFVILFIGLSFIRILFIFKIDNNQQPSLNPIHKPIVNHAFKFKNYFKKEIMTYQSCKTKLNREKQH